MTDKEIDSIEDWFDSLGPRLVPAQARYRVELLIAEVRRLRDLHVTCRADNPNTTPRIPGVDAHGNPDGPDAFEME